MNSAEFTAAYFADKRKAAQARDGGSQSSLNQTNLCNKKRHFDDMSAAMYTDLGFTVQEVKDSPVYRRAVIMKAAIKHVLDHQNAYDRKSPDFRKTLLNDLVRYMKGRYIEPSFVVKEQAQENAVRDALMVWRYLAEEIRQTKYFPRKVVEIEGLRKSIQPDAAFEYDDGKGIELVWYKTGKPTMSNTGRNNTYNRDMQLYLGILYGRTLGYRYITSSYYFLKFAGDRGVWDDCPQSFFGHTSNIITMTDEWIDGEGNALDDQMVLKKMMLRHGVEASEMSEKDCTYCDYKDMCQFQRAAKPIEE